MEVEFRLTPDDLAALRCFHQKHPPFPRQRRTDWTAIVSWGIAGFCIAVLYFLHDIAHDPMLDNLLGTFPGVAVGALLALVFLQIVTKLASRNATRKALEQGRNAEKVLGWRRISIDHRAIRVETEYSALTYLWWGVDAITASPDHAFIYFTTTNAFILPREAFRTDRAFEDFVEAARRYLAMAGVADARPAAIGADDWRERSRSAEVLPVARPGAPTAEERIAARTPPEAPRAENP